MPQLLTTHEFLQSVLDAGLLSEQQVSKHAHAAAAPDLAKRLVKERLLTPFQARVLLGEADPPPSFFLTDRYKLLEHLGAGGMGEVFLAEHLLLRRVVALKVIIHGPRGSSRGGTGVGAIERFFREARAVAALDHPNVVRVFDMDRTPTGPFLVMEYVDGTNIHTIVRRHGPLGVDRAVDAAKQAATGLAHAHGRGLIHRDIKPGNLLLDRRGTVKVVDLGLAGYRDIAENQGLTAAHNQNQLIGTADFVAPEQALDGSAADARSDVYGLGASLYFLLTGRTLFGEGNVAQKLIAHQMKKPVPACEIDPDVPEGLSAVVDMMLAKRPTDRPQSMDEVVELLAEFAPRELPMPATTEMPRHPPTAYLLGLAPPPRPAATPSLNSPTAGTKPNLRAARATPRGDEEPPSQGGSSRPRHDSAPPMSGPRSKRSLPRKPAGSRPELPKSAPVVVELVQPEIVDDAAGGKKVSRRAIFLGGAAAGISISAAALWYALGPGTGSGTPVRPNAGALPPPPSPTPPPPPTDVVLTGSGSTFVKPAMDAWAEAYLRATGVKVKYDGIGSGRGVDNMIDRVLQFGCTDVAMTDAQLKKAKDGQGDVVHVPLALGAVAITYNLPDVREPLRFTGGVLADVFLGKIRKWNDDAIAFGNPAHKLPDADITVVRRADSSGTTGIWTDYLSKVSGEWKAKVGAGTTVKWPVGVDAEKSSGVANTINKTVGSIGYVELSYALERNLKVAAVKNRAEKYVPPTLEGVTAAANAELQALPADLRFTLTDAGGDKSYPICGCSWAVLFATQPRAVRDELVRFLRWVVTDGQTALPALRYAPLPASMAARINEKLAQIRGEG